MLSHAAFPHSNTSLFVIFDQKHEGVKPQRDKSLWKDSAILLNSIDIAEFLIDPPSQSADRYQWHHFQLVGQMDPFHEVICILARVVSYHDFFRLIVISNFRSQTVQISNNAVQGWDISEVGVIKKVGSPVGGDDNFGLVYKLFEQPFFEAVV